MILVWVLSACNQMANPTWLNAVMDRGNKCRSVIATLPSEDVGIVRLITSTLNFSVLAHQQNLVESMHDLFKWIRSCRTSLLPP